MLDLHFIERVVGFKSSGPRGFSSRLRTDGAGITNKMASSHETSVPKWNPPSAAASGDRARQGRHQQRTGSLAKALDGRQQQQQRQVGDNMHRLLQEVAGSSDLLKDCIRAREALGTAKLRILRDRDEARKVSRITRSPSAILLHGGSWEDCGWDDDDDIRAGKNVAGVPGDDGEESPAMAAALPLAQEFADKMVELASVVPGLSRSLVELTAATTSTSVDGHSTPSADTAGKGGGLTQPPLPSADFDYVQEVIKVAPPVLARLLSFEHLRASETTGRDLVQALVNLYVGVRSPGLGSAVSQVYGGKLVRSKGLDELLGRRGVTAAHHDRAVQAELLKNTEVLLGLTAEGLRSKRKANKRSIGLSDQCVPSAYIPNNKSHINISSINNNGSGPQERPSRKRPRPAFTSASSRATPKASPARLGATMTTAGAGQQSLAAGTPDCCVNPTHNTSVPGFPVEAGAGTSRLFRDEGGFLLEACEEDMGLGLRSPKTEGPPELLLEHTVRALSAMLVPMGGGSQLPSQLLHACLQQDAYHLLAGPIRSGKASSQVGREPPFLIPNNDHRGSASLSASAAPQQLMSPEKQQGRQEFRSGVQPLPLPPASLLLPKDHSPALSEWEERVQGCLSTLESRPLLCPDALLRATGAAPSLPSEVCVRGGMAREGRSVSVDAAKGRNNNRGFPLSEACLFVGLDVVEEAVLGRGGEAAAGLLRAFRTVRNNGGGGGSYQDHALAGGGRGHAEGGEFSLFVAVLGQESHQCEDNVFSSTTAMSLPTFRRPFESELWLLVLGYRHWVMVAMVHIFSTDSSSPCVAGDTDAGIKERRQRQSSAVWLLAWYACGGYTKPPHANFSEMEEAVRQMTTCLTECSERVNISAKPPTEDENSSSAEAFKTGDATSASPVSAGVQVAMALKAAGEAGQGLMGEIFSPCLAVAWLLTSRLAVCNCEIVLGSSVLRQEDLDGAFRTATVTSTWTSAEESTHKRRSCCLESILQGLAALEDLVWLCTMRPPMSHVHQGQHLRALLKRTKAWVSGLLGNTCLQGEGGVSKTPVAADHLCGDQSLVDLVDFRSRKDAISQRLGQLLAGL
ncbi:expressed unknown protein [Ectocarpus siliculosus]|uniref:Uncharacterized protein n=1 Tax=Ectocarpus siliculosus TaxID=2880 RepID=D7FWC0_ECTSI|nr:expressed unknown protein [Ectocarpus siliculosus]|eukprot:CBJ32008.1 expressed unknown protein [Ectocarpus siliculosus]